MMICKVLNTDEIVQYRDILAEILKDIYTLNFDNDMNILQRVESDIERMHQFVKEGKAIVIGALENNNLTGFLWAYEVYGLEGRRVHIGQIGVQEQQRGQGIGQSLLNKVEEITKEKGITAIELMASVSNSKVVKFYNECGYQTERVKLVKGI